MNKYFKVSRISIIAILTIIISCFFWQSIAWAADYNKVPNKKYPTLEGVEFRGASDSQNLILKLKFSNNVGSIDEKQEDRWDMTGINQQNLTKFHLKVENGETIANMQAQPHPDAAKHTDESKYIYIYADGLDINKNYVLTVDEDFYANMGNSLATPYEVYFNIAGTSLDFKALKKLPEEVEIPALHLLSSSIINGSKNVALDSQITFSFAYNVSDPEVLENNRQCFTMTQGQQKVAIKIEKGSTEKDIVVIPVNKLLKSTEYKIVVDKNMMARNGATMSSPANLYFTTKGDESVPSGGGGGGGGGGGISPVPDPNANKEDVKNKEDQGDIYFSDVKDSWAVKDINKLADLGIVTGNPDKKFLPDKKISRAEAVIMLVRALELDSSQKITYQDTANHWAKDFISIAAANGMVKGINKNQFDPNGLVSREQMALMIVNGGKLQLNEKNKVSFGDMSGISSWAVKEVGIAASWQIIKGYEDGNFQPQAAVTRAEACRMIVNFLNLQEAKAPVGKIS